MESPTETIAPLSPASSASSPSSDTTPTTMSEPSTPKESPELEPVTVAIIEEEIQLDVAKTNAETNIKTETETEPKSENLAPAPAVNCPLARPTLPHAHTDTVLETVEETPRVELRWRGMYDRNRAANPGATVGS